MLVCFFGFFWGGDGRGEISLKSDKVHPCWEIKFHNNNKTLAVQSCTRSFAPVFLQVYRLIHFEETLFQNYSVAMRVFKTPSSFTASAGTLGPAYALGFRVLATPWKCSFYGVGKVTIQKSQTQKENQASPIQISLTGRVSVELWSWFGENLPKSFIAEELL